MKSALACSVRLHLGCFAQRHEDKKGPRGAARKRGCNVPCSNKKEKADAHPRFGGCGLLEIEIERDSKDYEVEQDVACVLGDVDALQSFGLDGTVPVAVTCAAVPEGRDGNTGHDSDGDESRPP